MSTTMPSLALPQTSLNFPSPGIAVMSDALHLVGDINRLCLVRHGPNLLHVRTAILQVCHVREQHLARLVALDVMKHR